MRAANVADPRIRSAMFSKLNSTPFAGQIIGDIAAKNVGIANQEEQLNFQGQNAYNRYSDQLAAQDYSQYVQRDRLKEAQRLGDFTNFANAFNVGEQHAFEFPAMESKYPNMVIDRDTGIPTFTGPTSPLTASSSTPDQQNKAKLAKIAEYKQMYPELDDKTIASTLYPTKTAQGYPYSRSNRSRLGSRNNSQYNRNPYPYGYNGYNS